MSSYNKNNTNRIPRDSVSISDKSYKVIVKEIATLTVSDDDKEFVDELSLKRKELEDYEDSLLSAQRDIEEKYRMLNDEKEQFRLYMDEVEKEHTKKRLEDYYLMKEFMWNNSVELAESIVNQKISSDEFSVVDMFEEAIKKLPVAFNELNVAIHPDTLQIIKNDNKENFVLSGVKWKLDYQLGLGEFIVEEKDEYYDFTLDSIFNDIRKRIYRKLEERRGELDV